MKFAIVLGFASLSAAGLIRNRGHPEALYFLDNDPQGASIVALSVGANGELSNPVKTSTGGKGMSSLGMNNTIPMADQLSSQDSVVVSGNLLFTVNAGSDTVSLFNIPSNDPSHPVLVGQPASSGGEFPSTVAYSQALNVACVMNTGAKAGVMCYRVNKSGLHPVGHFMSLPVNETTPPTGPPNMASDIVFNPSSTALFVTVKGNGKAPGFIASFPVHNGAVSDKVVISRPAELLIDFSVSFLNDHQAIITDPTYGAAKVEVNYPSLQVNVLKKAVVPGQGATCWSHYSPSADAVFLFDAGRANITAIEPQSSEIKYVIPLPASAKGSFDGVVAGEWLFVLQASTGISTISLHGCDGTNKIPTFASSFDSSVVGNRAQFMGLAAWTRAY